MVLKVFHADSQSHTCVSMNRRTSSHSKVGANAVVVKTISQQQNALTFDEAGGLKETADVCASPRTNRVLTDLQARNLAKIALKIRQIFGGEAEQDIEWGIMRGRIYIVQARPFIDK